jgi:hypothetical protein
MLDRYRREGIAKMSRYVTHIWAVNPDLLRFLPAEKSSFLPYAVDNRNVQAAPPRLNARTLTIVHAPTNREAKGTVYIERAIRKLNETRPGSVEYRVVEGVPHSEALKLYADADLVIDQLLIGWYGAFAVEMLQMGKPVICRISEEDLHFLPPDMAGQVMDAFIHATPETLYATLLRCVEDREFLAQRARAGQAYAFRWHSPQYVAGITKQTYEEALG